MQADSYKQCLLLNPIVQKHPQAPNSCKQCAYVGKFFFSYPFVELSIRMTRRKLNSCFNYIFIKMEIILVNQIIYAFYLQILNVTKRIWITEIIKSKGKSSQKQKHHKLSLQGFENGFRRKNVTTDDLIMFLFSSKILLWVTVRFQCFFLKSNSSASSFKTVNIKICYIMCTSLKIIFFLFPGRTDIVKFCKLPIINFRAIQKKKSLSFICLL